MLGRIAVHLNADAGCQRRIDMAIKLATTHDAELVGVYPLHTQSQPAYAGTALPRQITDMIRAQLQTDREEIEHNFMEQAKAAGITAHWRMPRGPEDEGLALHARYARLLIMSKAEARETTASPMTNLPESVIMAAGRPVLMVPTAGNIATLGERVLFCWDQRREAARAFMDAHPLLRTAKELIVLGIDEDTDDLRERDIQENDFSALCTALGHPEPKVLRRTSKDVGVGNVILNTATDYGVDLIVMGAYGHSRMRQWIMGGASKTLLSSMSTPVLLSH